MELDKINIEYGEISPRELDILKTFLLLIKEEYWSDFNDWCWCCSRTNLIHALNEEIDFNNLNTRYE